MESLIKRVVLRLFPELSARYHLPIFAEVVGVRETPIEGDVCDEFRPKYAVDVQVLDEHGKADDKWPVLRDVILSVPVAGHEMGHFAYPEDGCWVEIAFAYGSPNRPFIRSVLPHKLTMPTVERGEQRWQHNAESFFRIDKDGNHQRITDLKIHDKSLTRLVEALDVVEKFHRSVKNTKTNDSEFVGAIKRIEAMGAIILKTGGQLNIGAVKDLTLTSLTKNLQKAPKTWLGSQDENVLGLLSELMVAVITLCTALQNHKHVESSGALTVTHVQEGDVDGVKVMINTINQRLVGIKE